MKRTTVGMLVAVMALTVALQPTLAFAGATPSWLDHLNSIRALGALEPVTENTEWSAGCLLHARYMSLNRVITHSETSSLPYYSAAGDLAARRSNLALGVGGTAAVDLWAVGPFHALGMIDPGLRRVGFGSYNAERSIAGVWPSAALDVIRGAGQPVPGTVFPIMWPAPGSVSAYLDYNDHEYPDPLSGTGFARPSGAPIIVQFGSGELAPAVTASSLRSGGRDLAHAVYTELTYRNADASAQRLGRSALGSRDAVVMMPKSPLAPGAQYDVTLTVDGRTFAWSFSTQGQVDVAVSAPRTCGYAGPAAVSATLSSDDAVLVSREVQFEQSGDGVTWSSMSTSQTSDSGTARVDVAPVRRVFVRARFAGDEALPPRTSAPVAVVPAAKVGRPSVPSTMIRGKSVLVGGGVYPRHTVGSTVVRLYAQRYENGRWVTRARFNGYTRSTGWAYWSRLKLPYRGTWRVRAVHIADSNNATAASTWRRVVVH